MSEKEEALQHLSEIKSALVDKDSFFPYNYNALIVWGIIGMFLTLFMAPIFKESVLFGAIFSFVMMSIGFIVEGYLTKKVNADYDIEDCTKRQKFIMMMFTTLTMFGIALSALLAKYDLILLIFPVWLFLMGIGHYAVGFVLNINLFNLTSCLKMSVAILMMIGAYFVDGLGEINSTLYYIVQGVTFMLLGVLPIWMGRKLGKEL